MSDDLRLFALGSSPEPGRAVAAAAGTVVAPHEERTFEDGEHKARPLASVRGADAYVLTSLNGDGVHSANDKLCRLLFFCAALRDAAARRVTAVVPYLCYARKDRRTRPRDPVITRYVASLFEAMGIERVLTVDVHNPSALENAFRIPAESLEAHPLFVDHLATLIGDRPTLVLSPDVGGAKRAERLRRALELALGRGVPFGMMEKHRIGGAVTGDLFAGEVDGRLVVVADDLVSTGGTLARAARACRDRGAASVVAVATHGLFTAGSGALLEEEALTGVVVTDTVPPPPVADALRGRLTVLGIAPMLGEAIRRMHADEPAVEPGEA